MAALLVHREGSGSLVRPSGTICSLQGQTRPHYSPLSKRRPADGDGASCQKMTLPETFPSPPVQPFGGLKPGRWRIPLLNEGRKREATPHRIASGDAASQHDRRDMIVESMVTRFLISKGSAIE